MLKSEYNLPHHAKYVWIVCHFFGVKYRII